MTIAATNAIGRRNTGASKCRTGLERKVNYVLYFRRGDSMPAKKRADGDKTKYDVKYYHKNIKRIVLNFNLLKQEEKVMAAWIFLQGNVSNYIKSLIDSDMQEASLCTDGMKTLEQAENLAKTDPDYQPKQ